MVLLAEVPGEARVLASVISAFTAAEIRMIGSGSSTYEVSVPANRKTEATEVLRRDGERNNYVVKFH